MHGEDVACAQQVIQVVGLDDAFGQLFLAFTGQGHYLHIHRNCNAGNSAADLSQSHNAHLFVGQLDKVGVDITVAAAVAPHALVCLVGIVLRTPADVQQVGNGELCHTVGAIGRHIGHDDATTGSLLNINDIVSGSHDADVF